VNIREITESLLLEIYLGKFFTALSTRAEIKDIDVDGELLFWT
jgi:hypothetical protein